MIFVWGKSLCVGSSPLSFSALSPSPSLVGVNVSVFLLTNFALNPPQSSNHFDHFLELWVYAKQFIFGGLFIIFFCSRRRRRRRRRSKRKEDEEERRRRSGFKSGVIFAGIWSFFLGVWSFDGGKQSGFGFG